MQTFALKHRAQLTWEDLPFVEAPVFAHTHIMQMLNNPNHLWMRIEHLQEFIRTEIGSYNSLRNHDYANNQIEHLIGSGLYFNVCRTGKPFCAAFTWQEDPEHPHKGFWVDKLNYYWRASTAIKNQLMLIANQWHRLQTQDNSDENSLDEWISKTDAVAYAADPFTAKGMKSGYALSSPEQLKYISPVTEKSEIESVDYLGIVDEVLMKVGVDSAQVMCPPASSPPNPYKDVLDLIAKGEGGYNSMNNGTRNNKIINSTHNASIYLGEDLTEMSLDEIMIMQQGTIDSGRKIFAAGRYQMIPGTLKSAVQSSELDPDINFTPKTQDQLAIQLIEKRKPLVDYLHGNHDDINAAMLSMSKEWASIPNPATGDSYYGNGNKSMHTVDEVKQVLINTRNTLARAK
ncbi:hypothetical protein [Cellvibrio sp. UBA7661]|uniref:hypothetical protein n=1 Tax=Cellvibrio sp. UBA7661 TaxID=1946311 RepID=UPI002F359AAB